MSTELHRAIVRYAGSDVPVQLVEALVRVESGGDVFGWNPEPHYKYLWDLKRNAPYRVAAERMYDERPPADFPVLIGDRDAEWWGQQASWGPLQVMGAVAREYGFRKHFPALCSIDDGLSVGIHHLMMLARRFRAKWGWEGVVAAYNAGGPRVNDEGMFVNQSYVDKVRKAGGL